jgi:hypothetical protein
VSPGRRIPTTESEFEVEDVSTEESVEVFVDQYLKRTTATEDQMEESYSYPRTPTKMIWETYVYWCEEINGIEPKEESIGKPEIADILGVEKGTASYAGWDTRPQCYKRTKFNGDGYDLYNFINDD